MQKRTVLLWMILFLLISNTFVTLNINVAIISMVRPTQEKHIELNNTKIITCPNTTFYWNHKEDEKIISTNINLADTYDWSDYEKRTVLSAYHWLSCLSILPGSILAQKYGTKIVVGYSLCISASMSSIIPIVASYGASVVMYVRMVQGFFSFIAMPGGILTIIGNWSSTEDRGKFVGIILVGSSLALGLGNFLFGYIGQYLHWKYIFHLTSACGIIWTTFWYFLVHDFPEKHPTISTEEKTEIRNAIKHTVTDKNIPIPWTDILTSVPVIVCSLMIGAMMCNFFLLITFIPSYISDTYGLDSSQTGIIVSLPLFLCGACAFGFGSFVDYFIKKRWMSITNSRKLFSFLGCFMASFPLLIMAYTKCNITVIIVAYIVCSISRAINTFGIEPALIDMSPKFCGILQGLMGTESELMTLAFATGISHLSKLLPAEQFWKVVFIFSASIGILTSILFSIWGSADTQPWNQGSKKFRTKETVRQEMVTSALNIK